MSETQVTEAKSDADLTTFTREETAAMLKVTTRTLDEWVKKGLIKRLKLGRMVRFSRASIRECINRVDGGEQ